MHNFQSGGELGEVFVERDLLVIKIGDIGLKL